MDDLTTFPHEWNDDTRMAVLFAPFRDKSVNPKAWEQKLHFWTKLISDVCRQRKCLMFDQKSLTTIFRRREKVPLCFDTVIQEMVRSGELKEASSFQSQDSGWLGWGLSTFVKKPVSWGMSYFLRSSTQTTAQYVLVPLLETMAEQVMEEHYRLALHQWTDTVVEASEFRSQCQHLVPSEEEFALVLQHLERQRKILLAQTPHGETVIKFCRKTDKQVLPMQEIELNIFRIQRVEKALEKQIEALSEKMDGYTNLVKDCLRQGNKSMALHNLRKKKAMQKSFTQKSTAQMKLQAMLQQIDDAASNEMVVKAFECGLTSMKTINKEVGADRVADIMDELQETMEEQGEMSMLLAEGGAGEGDQGELEAELDALLAGSPAPPSTHPRSSPRHSHDQLLDAFSALDIGADLPSVPTHSPSASSPQKSRVQLES